MRRLAVAVLGMVPAVASAQESNVRYLDCRITKGEDVHNVGGPGTRLVFRLDGDRLYFRLADGGYADQCQAYLAWVERAPPVVCHVGPTLIVIDVPAVDAGWGYSIDLATGAFRSSTRDSWSRDRHNEGMCAASVAEPAMTPPPPPPDVPGPFKLPPIRLQ